MQNWTIEPGWSFAVVYLRAAQAYMLISMPTGTSTIFGAFQAIPNLPWRQTLVPRQANIELRALRRKKDESAKLIPQNRGRRGNRCDRGRHALRWAGPARRLFETALGLGPVKAQRVQGGDLVQKHLLRRDRNGIAA